MNKLEQSARQALMYLEESQGFRDGLNKAITALREALAEPQVDWKEEAMRLGGLNAKHVGELRKLEAEQAEQEPVAWMNEINGFICKEKTRSYHVPLYTVPVRTKDLTDDEISRVWMLNGGGLAANCYHEFARAVIAADREKNK